MNDELEAWGAVLAGLAAAAGLGVRWMRGRAKSETKPADEDRPQPQDGGPRPVRPRRADGDPQ